MKKYHHRVMSISLTIMGGCYAFFGAAHLFNPRSVYPEVFGTQLRNIGTAGDLLRESLYVMCAQDIPTHYYILAIVVGVVATWATFGRILWNEKHEYY